VITISTSILDLIPLGEPFTTNDESIIKISSILNNVVNKENSKLDKQDSNQDNKQDNKQVVNILNDTKTVLIEDKTVELLTAKIHELEAALIEKTNLISTSSNTPLSLIKGDNKHHKHHENDVNSEKKHEKKVLLSRIKHLEGKIISTTNSKDLFLINNGI
jgi:hypothetical protein